MTVKLAASAALPVGVFERAETGARPLNAAIFVTLCASVFAPPAIVKAIRAIPNPGILMALLLLDLRQSLLVKRLFDAIQTVSNNLSPSGPTQRVSGGIAGTR